MKPKFDYEKCSQFEHCKDLKNQGSISMITNKVYCRFCLHEKFRVEGSAFSHFRNVMNAFMRNYPNPTTKEEIENAGSSY